MYCNGRENTSPQNYNNKNRLFVSNSTGYFNARGQKKEEMYIVEAERWRGEIRMRIN
jgi:hypothetical protein